MVKCSYAGQTIKPSQTPGLSNAGFLLLKPQLVFRVIIKSLDGVAGKAGNNNVLLALRPVPDSGIYPIHQGHSTSLAHCPLEAWSQALYASSPHSLCQRSCLRCKGQYTMSLLNSLLHFPNCGLGCIFQVSFLSHIGVCRHSGQVM